MVVDCDSNRIKKGPGGRWGGTGGDESGWAGTNCRFSFSANTPFSALPTAQRYLSATRGSRRHCASRGACQTLDALRDGIIHSTRPVTALVCPCRKEMFQGDFCALLAVRQPSSCYCRRSGLGAAPRLRRRSHCELAVRRPCTARVALSRASSVWALMQTSLCGPEEEFSVSVEIRWTLGKHLFRSNARRSCSSYFCTRKGCL